jgi:hypothetical protein
MPPVVPEKTRIRSFRSEAAFERWLATHHEREPELIVWESGPCAPARQT